MKELILRQLWIFGVSVVYGIGTGLWYDMFRNLRRHRNHGDLLVHIEDFFFSFSVMVGFFWLLQRYNHGNVRLYIILGSILGIGLYYVTILRLAGRLMDYLVENLITIVYAAGRILLSPIILFAKYLLKLLKKTRRTVRIIKIRI